MNNFHIVISCEHAGNKIPEKYKFLFTKSDEALRSHQGWDAGAWEIANFLAEGLGTRLFGCQTSRLLIETNRSLNNLQLFSRFTQSLPKDEKLELINSVYHPYRKSVEAQIAKNQKPVLHLSIHTFTPNFDGQERSVDIGLLFDPDRASELQLCQRLHLELGARMPSFQIEFNKPYLGIDDGFTTYLRTCYGDETYLGIEIEVNQKYVPDLQHINQNLLAGLQKVLR